MNGKLVKKNGEKRNIEQPSDTQKKRQRKIIEKLKTKGELDFEDFNFSMKGPQKAVKKFEGHRDDGYQWVAKLDIESCFPSIDPKETLSLIDYEVEDIPEITDRRGLPQGHPLSNFLAEVYLDQFDKKVSDWPENGCKVIRYVDDIWLMCKKKKEVEIYFKFAVKYLNDLDLDIHSDSDSRASVKHVNEGVEVLGFVIDRRAKRPLPEKIGDHKEELISLLLRAYESDSESSTQYKGKIETKMNQIEQYYGKDYTQTVARWIDTLIMHIFE